MRIAQRIDLSENEFKTLTSWSRGRRTAKHRHQEWIRFLKLIDQQTPAHWDRHLIVDNYTTHKHPKVKSWLNRHPRFQQHFVPTSSSWLNMVECWFRDLTDKRIRRGVFKSVADLIAAIHTYMDNHRPKISSPSIAAPRPHWINYKQRETLH